MRQIKFRAFVKNLKWMIPVEMIDFSSRTVEVDLSDGNGDTSEYGFDEIELMQFTGLKDKDGLKEIYEGDIVKTIYGTYAVKWLTEECWLNLCGFHLCDSSGGRRELCKTFVYTIEIIGNIHENGGLINGE